MSHAGITWAELAGWMDGLRPAAADPDLRYNVPPTAMIAIIRRDGDALAGDFARWGLIPHWHRKPLADWKANTINARVESVATAASYRDAYQRARCVIPASGYFEWKTTDGSKQPYSTTSTLRATRRRCCLPGCGRLSCCRITRG